MVPVSRWNKAISSCGSTSLKREDRRPAGDPSPDDFRIDDSIGMASRRAGNMLDTGSTGVPKLLLVENRFPTVHPPFWDIVFREGKTELASPSYFGSKKVLNGVFST
jgi:hypothetical protein